MPVGKQPLKLGPGTPVAHAVTRGLEAASRADADAADAAYLEAVELAGADTELRLALAVDHTAKLQVLGRPTRALQRCDEYLRTVGANELCLRLLRAEICSSVGDHARADADVAAVRAVSGGRHDILTPDDDARLRRVSGLSAADRGRLDQAAHLLGSARRIFAEAGDEAGAAAVDRDLRMIALRRDDESVVTEVLAGGSPRTVSDCLLIASALKRRSRYEEAVQVLLGAASRDLDPALRLPVLWELVVLLRMTRQDAAAERFRPLLRLAAAASPDPEAGEAAVDRLYASGAPSKPASSRFDRSVQHARWLITDGPRLDEAARLLDELGQRARSDRDLATWHLGPVSEVRGATR